MYVRAMQITFKNFRNHCEYFCDHFFLAYQLLKIDSGEKYAVWSGTAELTLDTDRALT